MGRTKNIDRLYDDIEQDLKKISKEFNKQLVDEFKELYQNEADAWYKEHEPKTNDYERTYQLRDRALLIEKEDEYGKKISFTDKKIKPKKGKKPVQRVGKYGIWTDYSGTLPAYYSWNKKINENIASSVLSWEESGINNFSHYGYGRGNGIFGRTLKRIIQEIGKITPSTTLKINLPKEIINDLYNLLKNKTRDIIQKRYNEMF